MNNTSNIPKPVVDLITNLSILGLLEADQKLNVNTMSFSPSNSWGQCFYRFWQRESRQGLVDYLNFIIADTIDAIGDYGQTEYCKIIINHLALAKPGINNLAITYNDDPNILAQLKVILENIDIILDKNKKFLILGFKSQMVAPMSGE